MRLNSELLKKLRAKKGLTQDQLAREVGLDGGSWISAWESGRIRQPKWENLVRLSEFFGVPIDDLIEKERESGR